MTIVTCGSTSQANHNFPDFFGFPRLFPDHCQTPFPDGCPVPTLSLPPSSLPFSPKAIPPTTAQNHQTAFSGLEMSRLFVFCRSLFGSIFHHKSNGSQGCIHPQPKPWGPVPITQGSLITQNTRRNKQGTIINSQQYKAQEQMLLI